MRNTRCKVVITGCYSLMHAVVDMSCAVLLSAAAVKAGLTPMQAAAGVIVYDIVAFALQLPFGAVADRWNKNAVVSAIGCLLVALAFGIQGTGIAACVVAGFGNALFHVGGGIDVLNISEGKASLPGIYVATGAMGLYLGTKTDDLSLTGWMMVTALIASAVLLLWVYRKAKRDYGINNAPCTLRFHPERVSTSAFVILGCLLLTICVRGGFGLAMRFSWNNSFEIGLISVSAVVLGKALGGIIGDRLGWLRTSVTSLGASAILFFFAYDSMFCGLLALFLFNMTMPITLTALANLFPRRKGAAFGATTLALVGGALPVLFGYRDLFAARPVLIAATAVSTLFLWLGLAMYKIEMETAGTPEEEKGNLPRVGKCGTISPGSTDGRAVR